MRSELAVPAHPAIVLEEVEVAWSRLGAAALVIERLAIAPGERVVVEGPSGGGKSTLLSLLAGVLVPRRGRALVLGRDLAVLSRAERDRLRGTEMGLVFQLFHLLSYLDVVANVALSCRLFPERRRRLGTSLPRQAARQLALSLGLEEVLGRPVAELSVGQQQRVAVARALLGDPALVLADEPTSALDPANRDRFLELLDTAVARIGATLVVASHDPAVVARFDRRLRVCRGRLEELS